MPITRGLSDAEFTAHWENHGSAGRMASALGMTEAGIRKHRRNMEKRGIFLKTRPAPGYENMTPDHYQDKGWTFPRQYDLWMHEGSVVVFSDAHYWPGEASLAHKALLNVIRKVQPRTIIANGDVFDGISVGRHPPFGWHERPSVKDELDACIERMGEIEQAAPNGCKLLWNVGNHCIRFERSLAMHAKEFVGMAGFRLTDHFPAWDIQWSTMINGRSHHPVMVKHRVAGGIHAAYNNALKGGVSIATGHTHILEVKPWVDYRGRRWGIQTGTLADHHGAQFEYTENSPSPACSGFAVLTFRNGKMLPPELCEVIEGEAIFRGEVV